MEKILKIEETFFRLFNERTAETYEGFQIVTDLQTIKIGIGGTQSCCETFGCIITNDDVTEFIGAQLKSITLVDETLNNKKIEELEYLNCGGAMFVNLETSNGLLQFVAYNSHNGYYGHEAVLVSKQLNHSDYL